MTSPDQIARLKAAAEKAKVEQSGEWRSIGCDVVDEAGCGVNVCRTTLSEDAVFFALANPATVLALLVERDEQEAALSKIAAIPPYPSDVTREAKDRLNDAISIARAALTGGPDGR